MSQDPKKDKRKALLRQLKEKEREAFLNSLPMKKELFHVLFDHLDENLADGCNHTMMLTITFLEKNGIENVTQVIEWINENGGYCDCEVLANLEEKFE